MKLFRSAFVALCLLAPLVQAADAMRVAVIDSEMAVKESDAIKRYEAKDQFAPRIKNLNALQADIRQMEEKLQKDGPVLSPSELESRQLEIRRKFEDLQRLDQQLRMDKGQADEAELQKLRPKMDEAIRKVSEAQKFDLVLERRVAHYVKPEFDITRQVIDAVNKMK